jgi:TonB-linked SusC/RagA family outer membrane protein
MNVKKSRKWLLTAVLSIFFCASAFAQNSVSGTVSDEAGEPIIGAYITLVGDASVGTITDFDGNYEISVPDAAKLTFSYTGYKSQTVAVGGKSVVNVSLQEDSKQLEEVVAIGYGSQTKKELTGSVVSVKADDMNKGSFNGAQGMLQGKVAGLNMSKSGGGDPTNRDYSVQIRGTGSLSGNNTPLYIIDGVPGASMNNINPSDIESMDVLKDGSAAAIYGTRANAGVVIVTTKKGKEGKTQVEYNGSVRTDLVAGKIDVLSADEFVKRGGLNYGYDTDWFKEITRVPVSTEHNLSLSGGMEKVNYRASINYKSNQGLAKNSSFDELIGRVNVNQKALNKMLDINYDLSYSTTNSKWVEHEAFQQSIKYNPTMPVKVDVNDPMYKTYGGFYQNFDKNGFVNPASIVEQPTKDGKDQTFLGSIRATLTPITGLKISGFGSYQLYNQTTGNYFPMNSEFGGGVEKEGQAERYTTNNVTRMVEATVQYGNEIKKNAFTFMVGYAYQDFVKEEFSAKNTKFFTDKFLYNSLESGEGLNNLANGGSNDGIGMASYKEEWKLASFFGRFIYNYDQRYFLNASVRAEGSSKFGVNNRWGWFPAVSASWLISNESFMRDQNVVDELKLRAGFGITGNVPDNCYPWIGLMKKNEDYAYFGDKKVTTYSMDNTPNPDLKWETKTEYNVGVDFGFLGGRLSGSIEYYNRTTNDLLYWFAVDPSISPNGSMLGNAGCLQNQGVELAISGIPVKTDKFTWNLGLTAAHNQNKVVSLGNDVFKFPENDRFRGSVGGSAAGWTSIKLQKLEEGKPVGNYYGYKFSHIDDNGVFYGFDRFGNVKKMSSLKESDQDYLGNALPYVNWGISSMMSFYGVDFSFNIRGAIGGKLLNTKRMAFGSKSALTNGNIMVCKDNDYTTPIMMTDYYLEDGTYAKLGDVTIGYTFNIKENVAKYLSHARIYVTGQNLLTLSSYSGVDPENVNMGGLEPGIEDVNYYPTARTFMLGVNLAF